MRNYLLCAFLVFQISAQSSFAAAENDEAKSAFQEIQTVIDEYCKNVEQIKEQLAELKACAAQNQSAEYWKSRSKILVGLSAFLASVNYVVGPAAWQAYLSTLETGQWLFNCPESGIPIESECSRWVALGTVVSLWPAITGLSWKYGHQVANFFSDQIGGTVVDVPLSVAMRGQDQRSQALECEKNDIFARQAEISRGLLNRNEEIKALDEETRRSVFQAALQIGDIAVMRALLNADDPNESTLIEDLDALKELKDCPVCQTPFSGESFDALVVRGCNSKHWFHKSCMEKWYQNKRSCPLCRDTAKPDLRQFSDSVNHILREPK